MCHVVLWSYGGDVMVVLFLQAVLTGLIFLGMALLAWAGSREIEIDAG